MCTVLAALHLAGTGQFRRAHTRKVQREPFETNWEKSELLELGVVVFSPKHNVLEAHFEVTFGVIGISLFLHHKLPIWLGDVETLFVVSLAKALSSKAILQEELQESLRNVGREHKICPSLLLLPPPPAHFQEKLGTDLINRNT